jgi:hypothetical protein
MDIDATGALCGGELVSAKEQLKKQALKVLLIGQARARSALGSYIGFSEASAAKRSPAISIS